MRSLERDKLCIVSISTSFDYIFLKNLCNTCYILFSSPLPHIPMTIKGASRSHSSILTLRLILQVLGFLDALFQQGETRPVLIVAPVTLIDTWLRECKKREKWATMRGGFGHAFRQKCIISQDLKNGFW